jgi:hypothetical protein
MLLIETNLGHSNAWSFFGLPLFPVRPKDNPHTTSEFTDITGSTFPQVAHRGNGLPSRPRGASKTLFVFDSVWSIMGATTRGRRWRVSGSSFSMSLTSETDAVARPLPFLSFKGVETCDTSSLWLASRDFSLDDERTLPVVLSTVKGGVTNCLAAETDLLADAERPVTLWLGALLVGAECSRAF